MADTSPPRIPRIPLVRNEPRKRKFDDGTPREAPSKILKRVVHQVVQKIQEEYNYPDLGPGEDIRVLIVEKGRRGDIVRCRLVTSPLPPPPDKCYEALSYYWGEGEPTIPIIISAYNPPSPHTRYSIRWVQEKRFWVRPNLHDALVQLRSPDEVITLWVDAICINQENKAEKTEQISKMHDIYSKADSICIWLGVGEPEGDGTQETFQFIREMLDLRLLDQRTASVGHARQWLAFVQLMRNRWFSRRWVVQELALARDATVHHGKEGIRWSDFSDAVALFVTKHDQIKQLVASSGISPDPDPIGDMRALGANILVEATSNLFRKSDTGEIRERLLSLEILVSTLLAFEAKDPRDTVYGVLSIAKDTPYADSSAVKDPDPRITPNYDKTLADLCMDFIDYCIETSKSLDIICRHWAPVAKHEWKDLWTDYMPSWVSLISGSPFGEPEAALSGRSNGDSLVGTPSRQHQKNYNASAGLLPAAEVGRLDDTVPPKEHPEEKADNSAYLQGGHTRIPDPSRTALKNPVKKCNGILNVKGMVLDTIDELSPRSPEGMILKESLKMGGWTTETEAEKVPDSLWRTLVADRGPQGINAPSWYYRACLESLYQITQNGDLNTGALIENPHSPSTMVTFLRRVQQVVWNRKFLRSREKKLFGLAPTEAEPQDYICILFGCSVPVILRKLQAEAEGGPFYTFVGEAYVHGMMDGEAVSKHVPEYPYDDYETFQIK